MKKIVNDLNGLAKGIKQIIQQVEKLQKDLKPYEKFLPATKSKAKAVKKPTSKRTAAKKTTPTAPEIIFGIIAKSRSKKGVSSAMIQAKTGFNNQKVRDNLYRLKKRGKIKNTQKGFYTKA